MHKKTTHASTLILVVLMALLATNSTAAPLRQSGDPPGQISYQGHLLDASNEPVPDGDYSMEFYLYVEATGGDPLWDETHDTVTTSAGYFSVLLGSEGNPITADVLATGDYLEVTVEGEPLAPRHQLASAPSAITVPWAGLTGVPAGLDDGDDDTTYTAGEGLLIEDTEIRVDFDVVPRGSTTEEEVESFQEEDAFSTHGAQDWEFFTIGSESYQAVANYYGCVSFELGSI